MRKGRPTWKFTLLYTIALLLSAIPLSWLARSAAGFAEWYALHIFPVFANTLGRFISLLPFSVAELVLVLGALLFLFLLPYSAWMLRNAATRSRLKTRLGRLLRRLLCLAATLVLLFVLTCGINYSRDTFAEAAGLSVEASTTEELIQLYLLLVDQGERLLPLIATDEAERFQLERGSLHARTRAAMQELAADYTHLIRYYPNPKPVLLSRLMSQVQLGGFYAAPLVEANYNREMPDQNVPFTVCHELAHLSGYAREDEANFVGYLACIKAKDAELNYSGTFYALNYVLQSLRKQLPLEEYRAYYALLPGQLIRDFAYSAEFWRQYQGKAAEIYNNANDAYLKANAQQDGVQSYGRMVDLLLAYYRDQDALAAFAPLPPEPEFVLPEINLEAEQLYSSNALLADLETCAILYAKAGAEAAQPASVTKVLTAITAIELIEDVEATVTMRGQDFRGLYEAHASLSGFAEGEEVRYLDLLYTLMLVSGCDSANALANNLAGGLTEFAALMNQKLADLGLSNSHFVNPSGLSDPEQYTTAEDMAVIFAAALQNPLFREIITSASYEVPPTNYQPEGMRIPSYFFYRIQNDFEGARLANGSRIAGGKTGYTRAAGLCLAVLAEHQEREYIAIIFGGPGDNKSPQYNFIDALTLFGEL